MKHLTSLLLDSKYDYKSLVPPFLFFCIRIKILVFLAYVCNVHTPDVISHHRHVCVSPHSRLYQLLCGGDGEGE